MLARVIVGFCLIVLVITLTTGCATAPIPSMYTQEDLRTKCLRTNGWWRGGGRTCSSAFASIAARSEEGPLMAGVFDAIRVFVLEHRGCGQLCGDVESIAPEGYEVQVSCRCEVRLEQWVTAADAEADLLRSALLAFEN